MSYAACPWKLLLALYADFAWLESRALLARERFRSMTQFDPPPYQVGIQSNAGGDITISDQASISIAGHDLHFGMVQDKQEFLSQLEKLKEAFVQAGETHVVSEETAIDAEAEIRKAIGQVKKPAPSKKSVLDYLTAAKSLVEGIGGASGLVASLASAIEAVHKLLS
jgi:hypothetical protein